MNTYMLFEQLLLMAGPIMFVSLTFISDFIEERRKK